MDFEDEQFGGYSVDQLEMLLNECNFLDLIERPGLWRSGLRWVVLPGMRPEDGRLTEKIFRVIYRHAMSVCEREIRRKKLEGGDLAMSAVIKATPEVVQAYWQLFVNRRAYTMQSMRPHPETGRHYYFRPSRRGTDTPLMLTDETIRQHLEGKVTVGLYAINPSNQRCKWVAIDADYKNAMEDLLKLQYRLTQDRVEPALEMSRRGGHLWIFLATPLLAQECRIYIHDLALGLGVPVKGSGLAEGIEVFPKHDTIGAGEFGNAIRGPLGIHRGANRRFWFYGADYTLEDQIAYLKQLAKSHRGRAAKVSLRARNTVGQIRRPMPRGRIGSNGKRELLVQSFASWST